VEVALGIATNLASRLLEAAGRVIRDEVLGDHQQRALRDVFTRATAVLLVTAARSMPDSPASLERLGKRFARFFEDRWVADILVGAALLSEPLHLDRLRNRFDELGLDSEEMPVHFDEAMRVLVVEVDRRLREEAAKAESPLHNLVVMSDLAAIRRALEDRQPQDFPEAATPAERQDLLPPPPTLVLGREDELQAVKRALGVGLQEAGPESGGTSRRVKLVHGWPGIGKTTFVSELCHDREVLEHFTGGVFFLPVGRLPDARRLAEEVCLVLQVPAPPTATLEALRSRIANALSQRRILLVFDDVWEEHHVAPLLVAGGGSAALVATRRLDVATRLATESEGPFRLNLLSEEDSLGLLRDRAPGVVVENEEACRRLARELDGLPLALRVAADLLRVESGSGFDVSGLLAELTEATRVLGEEAPADVASGAEGEAEEMPLTVRTLLRKSVESMNKDLVRRFARLGVLPPKPLSFDPWTAADMWRGTSEDPAPEDGTTKEKQARAQAALGELVRRGLVEPAGGGIDPLAEKLNLRSKRPERFWMHALVAAFALETLERTEGEGEVREAQQRRLEHYRRVVGAADGALSWGGEVQLFSVYVMALDLPNIRAAHGWARSRSSGDRRALRYLSRLPSQGSRALSGWLGRGEFLEWMRLAEEAARKIGDEDAARTHMANVGAALIRNGLTQDALQYCRESLEAARLHDDASAEAATLGNLASIHDSMGEHETALNYAQQAEEVARRAEEPNVEAGAIGQQATSLKKLGRLAEAEGRYDAMRNLAWSNGELSRYAKALRGLADMKRYRPEQRDDARQMYEEAADVFWDLKEFANYRGALNGLGILETEAGALDAAEEAFGRALKSAVDDENERDQALAKMQLGIVYRDRGTELGIQAAEAEYRAALPLAASSGDAVLLGDVLVNIALLLHEKGDKPGARAAAVDAAEAYENVNSEKESWVRRFLEEIDGGHD